VPGTLEDDITSSENRKGMSSEKNPCTRKAYGEKNSNTDTRQLDKSHAQLNTSYDNLHRNIMPYLMYVKGINLPNILFRMTLDVALG
jgi:hypothetical protein